MARDAQRVLAVSVRCRGMAAVLLEGGDVLLWSTSRKGTQSTDKALEVIRRWVKTYRPDVLVTENPDQAGRKSGRQIRTLRALVDMGSELDILGLVVRRDQSERNVYEQAASFAAMCPELKRVVPQKPAIWKSEPRTVAVFEALGLARSAGLLRSIADRAVPPGGNL